MINTRIYLRGSISLLCDFQASRYCFRQSSRQIFRPQGFKSTALQLCTQHKTSGLVGRKVAPAVPLIEFSLVKSALLRYKEVYGNLLVPEKFCVPLDDDSWLKETRGMKLGKIVIRIRAGNRYEDHLIELQNIGFDYYPQRNGYGFATVKSALVKYKSIHGNMLVPARFTVPSNDISWFREIWDMKLGRIVASIRRGNVYKNHRAYLQSIGFDYNPQREQYDHDSVKAALLRYKDIYNNMLLPRDFCIPTDNEIWPEDMRGMQLGKHVYGIRSADNHKDHREDLESIGFDYNPQRKSHTYSSIKLALLQYKDIYGDMLVPYTFSIPYDDESWPKKARGMKIGKIVNNIRRGRRCKNHQAELESIGFDYRS